MTPIARWSRYEAGPGSTVVGELVVGEELAAHQIPPRRPLALLPPSYHDSDRAYPVLYMHDGDNLFDEKTSNDGEWQVDETMQVLAAEGIEAIVVGIPNGGDARAAEYVPWDNPVLGGGRGDDYLSFVTEAVMPFVEATLRVATGRTATGIMGSSLGGFISLYGLLTRPEHFGFAGVLSPAFWWSERFAPWLDDAPFVDARIYMDVGTREIADDPARSRHYLVGYERTRDTLRAKGYGADRLRAVVDDGAIHHETAWARRLPDALRWLLPRM